VNPETIQVVVLDAMGVIYRYPDDVGSLLIPFIESMGAYADRSVVEPLYLECSRGRFTSAELWRTLSVSGDPDDLDNRYLAGHELTDGLLQFLDAVRSSGRRIAALTNDVDEWSRLLRNRFGLGDHIEPWVVSGDVGERKPHESMFAALCRAVDAQPEEMLFVDDRTENLDAAASFGFKTVHFSPEPDRSTHLGASTFAQLSFLLELAPS
jgi:putative hydrolase of the HAD superfamily